MSPEHKEALAAGRTEGRHVRAYLEALEKNKPRRGRKRSIESLQRRLETVENDLKDASGVERLILLQERVDLRNELDARNAADNIAELQARFIKVAKAFSQRKGIDYATWREFGVPASVLKEAGITRSRGS